MASLRWDGTERTAFPGRRRGDATRSRHALRQAQRSELYRDDRPPSRGPVHFDKARVQEGPRRSGRVAGPRGPPAGRRPSILQHQFDALPVDDTVAASYGQVAAAVARAGRQPRARTMDLFIAATAHAHAACVYTRNPKDFVGADGLVEAVAV